MGLGGGFVGQMERLRVVFARELEHFLAGHLIRAELGLRADLQILEISSSAAHIARRRLARAQRARYRSRVATQAPIGRWHPRLDRGGDGAEREPARCRRATPKAAPERRSVRRCRDSHAGRAGGADRALERFREPAPPSRRARAGLDRAEGQSCDAAWPHGPAGRGDGVARRYIRRRSRTMSATGTSRPRRSLASAISRRPSSFTKTCSSGPPNQPGVWISYGHMLKTVGRQTDGIDAYRHAIAMKPSAWRSVVEPGQPQDRQVRRGRRRGDAGGAEIAGPRRRRSFPSRFRARQGDARRRPTRTRPSTIIRRAMRCAARPSPTTRDDH